MDAKRASPESLGRYADDGVIHCNSLKEAEEMLKSLEKRLSEVGLEIHPEKTRIVYCKKENRNGSHTHEKFDFLGYTFRSRLVKSKHGKFCPSELNSVLKYINKALLKWVMNKTKAEKPKYTDKSKDKVIDALKRKIEVLESKNKKLKEENEVLLGKLANRK